MKTLAQLRGADDTVDRVTAPAANAQGGEHVLSRSLPNGSAAEAHGCEPIPPELHYYGGTQVITISADLTAASVEWRKASSDADEHENRMYCLVLDPDAKRTLEYVESRRIRRSQQLLRERLLALDGGCVLSGETTEAAVHAARIVEVRDPGSDDTANGMLMRSDLHGMYDAGCFHILSTGKVAIAESAELSDAYRELLGSAELPPHVLRRVRQVLVDRLTFNTGEV